MATAAAQAGSIARPAEDSLAADSVELGGLIDRSRLTPLQIRVIVCCAAAAFLDGLDMQSIGIAAPLIARDLGIERAAMAPVISAGLVGAGVGAMLMGAIGDYVGRRWSLIVSILIFGLGTIATAVSTDRDSLLLWRAFAGIGMGAATPCFISLTAEYVPTRIRALAVSTMWAAFPLGGAFGGFLNPAIGQAFGWRSIFYFGGGAPLLLAVACLFALPESLRFLAAKGRSVERIRAIVRKLAPEAAGASSYTVAEPPPQRGAVVALFKDGRAFGTVLLALIFVFTFTSLIFQPLMLPTLLSGPGAPLTLQQAGTAVALSNLGSVFGTAGVGYLYNRVGLPKVMLPAYLIGAAFLASVALPGAGPAWAFIGAAVSCFCFGACSAGALTLGAAIYPTALRSTGVGFAMSAARLSQIALSFVVLGLQGLGWSSFQIFVLAGGMGVTAAICILLLARSQGDARLAMAPAARTVRAPA
jgi:AAHS family 4-hydroxybenzoate transporter-like MFS transporter